MDKFGLIRVEDNSAFITAFKETFNLFLYNLLITF